MNTTERFSINITVKLFDEREVAGTILKFLYNKVEQGKEPHIGTYQGFNIFLRKSILFESHEVVIHGDLKYRANLGDRPKETCGSRSLI